MEPHRFRKLTRIVTIFYRYWRAIRQTTKPTRPQLITRITIMTTLTTTRITDSPFGLPFDSFSSGVSNSDLGCCDLPSQINCSVFGFRPSEATDRLSENETETNPDVGSLLVFECAGIDQVQASRWPACGLPDAEPKTRNPDHEKRNADQRIAERRSSNCDRRRRPTRGTVC